MLRRLAGRIRRRRSKTPEQLAEQAEALKQLAEQERNRASSPGINPGSYSGGP